MNNQRRFVPAFNELCSAELLNQKLLIPCDPVKYLDSEYGTSKWQTPVKGPKWSNLIYQGEWSDSEWPKAVRYYYNNGTVKINETLKHLNRYTFKWKMFYIRKFTRNS